MQLIPPLGEPQIEHYSMETHQEFPSIILINQYIFLKLRKRPLIIIERFKYIKRVRYLWYFLHVFNL